MTIRRFLRYDFPCCKNPVSSIHTISLLDKFSNVFENSLVNSESRKVFGVQTCDVSNLLLDILDFKRIQDIEGLFEYVSFR